MNCDTANSFCSVSSKHVNVGLYRKLEIDVKGNSFSGVILEKM